MRLNTCVCVYVCVCFLLQKRNITGTGYWDYENILLRWYNTSEPLRPADQYCISRGYANTTTGGDGGDGVPAAAIAVPVAVGVPLVLAAVAVLVWWVRRRRHARQDGRGMRGMSGEVDGSSEVVVQFGHGGAGDSRSKSTTRPLTAVTASASQEVAVHASGSGHQAASKATEVQIEAIRRNLASAVPGAATRSDQIELVELLGEGTFGRVYKGIWRGTIVAVKTMVGAGWGCCMCVWGGVSCAA